MSQSIETTGKSIDEAIQKALRSLQTDRDSVTVEVLEKPKSGFLGFGSAPARVRVALVSEDPPARKPLPGKPAAGEATRTAPPNQTNVPSPKPVPPAPRQSPPPTPQTPQTSHTPPASHTPSPRPAAQQSPKKSFDHSNEKRGRQYHDRPQEPVEEARVAKIKLFLEETLDKMGMQGVTVRASQETKHLLLDMSGTDMGRIIGRRGETLDAIQRIVSGVANHNEERHIRVVVDTENYRKKREDALVELANRSAERALRQHRNVPLEPMNSYARHVIHATLQDRPGISTHSVGSEPNRRVIVAVPGGGGRPPRGNERPNRV